MFKSSKIYVKSATGKTYFIENGQATEVAAQCSQKGLNTSNGVQSANEGSANFFQFDQLETSGANFFGLPTETHSANFAEFPQS